MTVKQFYERISARVPASLSAPWDRDGLMVCPDENGAVKRVLCTLDVTEEAVDYAIANGFDLIISHHPLLFHPIAALTPSDHVARKAVRLYGAGISVIFLHTRADAVEDGVNDRLADLLGLDDVEVLEEDAEGIARIGTLAAPMTLSDFALQVKEALGVPTVLTADADRTVCTVAVCGGDGKDLVDAAIAAGADTYVSGRIGYHQMMDAPERGINMIEAGHYYTETHITAFFAELVGEILPFATCEEFASDMILFI